MPRTTASIFLCNLLLLANSLPIRPTTNILLQGMGDLGWTCETNFDCKSDFECNTSVSECWHTECLSSVGCSGTDYCKMGECLSVSSQVGQYC